MSNERALWVAVLQQALWDAGSRSWKTQYERGVACAWIGSKDFVMVCDLAGLDSDWVLENIPRVLKKKWGDF